MEAAFECNKNRTGGFEYPFYIASIETDNESYEALPHWHYHFEILYFPYGTAKVFIGNKPLDMKSGDLILVSPCEVHSVLIDAGIISKHFIIGFDTELLTAPVDMNFEIKYILPQVVDTNPDYRILRIDVESLAAEIKDEYTNKCIGFELAVTSGIYRLMTHLLRYLQSIGLTLSPAPTLQKNTMMKLIKLLNYIDKHFDETITAASAAEMCYLSYSHFSKLFKSVMNTSFIQYLNNIRIRKAESLLLDGEKSITQIALETGFANVSYFIKQFKQYKIISPKQYQGLLLNTDRRKLYIK